MRTQELLGADIQMVLDVCPPLPSPARRGRPPPSSARPPGRRGPVPPTAGTTRRCSGSCRAASTRRCGTSQRRAHRRRSTSTATASAGCRWGRPRPRCSPALAAAIAVLPADRPRYLMGVGDPARLVEAIALGVDQFDCVMQTRLGRHGTALTGAGKLHVEGRPPRRRRPAARRGLRVRRVLPPLPRLRPPPVQGRRADGVAAGEPAQHRLDAAADAAGAGGRSWRPGSTASVAVMSVWG